MQAAAGTTTSLSSTASPSASAVPADPLPNTPHARQTTRRSNHHHNSHRGAAAGSAAGAAPRGHNGTNTTTTTTTTNNNNNNDPTPRPPRPPRNNNNNAGGGQQQQHRSRPSASQGTSQGGTSPSESAAGFRPDRGQSRQSGGGGGGSGAGGGRGPRQGRGGGGRNGALNNGQQEPPRVADQGGLTWQQELFLSSGGRSAQPQPASQDVRRDESPSHSPHPRRTGGGGGGGSANSHLPSRPPRQHRGQNARSGGGQQPGNAGNRAPRRQDRRRSRSADARPAKDFLATLKEAEDLMASLSMGLSNSTYECMICYDTVKTKDKIWACNDSCFAVFHFECIREWSQKSARETTTGTENAQSPSGVWRCPGCQNPYKQSPRPSCFCTKLDDVPFNRYLVPHSCGNPCLKELSCIHKCTLTCHPGPCKPCESMAPAIPCHCGRTQFLVRCSEMLSADFDPSCHEECGQPLSCGLHFCADLCHAGPCKPCEVTSDHHCLCGKASKTTPCGEDFVPFSCNAKCGFDFACGHHRCERDCHDPAEHTVECPYDPTVVKTCPCGSKRLHELLGTEQRVNCTSDIPTCNNLCSKQLSCRHNCSQRCHTGPCPPCKLQVTLKCRCGKTESRAICSEIERDSKTGGYIAPVCETICKKQRLCKRHQCGEMCCPIGNSHQCDLLCAKVLKCGRHNCTMSCGHPGRCHDCFEGVSFDELLCHCGRTVVLPPIPCGTPPPKCLHPCVRELPCGHVSYSTHNCHPDSESCPPCVIFVDRQCACGRKTMKNIPCSRQGAPSCGEPCLKVLDGCGHKCKRSCHSGPCISETHRCMEKCGNIRPMCGHTCAFPCHGTSFCTEEKPCKFPMEETCKCRNKKNDFLCSAWKESMGRQGGPNLQCDDTCALLERNRKLAEAFDITTPTTLSGTLPISATSKDDGTSSSVVVPGNEEGYDAFLLRHAYMNPTWTRSIEQTLAEFVKDPSRRAHHFMRLKPAGTQFVRLVAPFYKLVADVLDAERGQASVIIRKTAAKAPAVPARPVSVVAVNYTAIAAASSALQAMAASSTPSGHASGASSHSSGGDAINALQVIGLQEGIDERDLKIFLEPILGSGITCTWIVDQPPTDTPSSSFAPSVGESPAPGLDCIIQVSSARRMKVEDAEALLVKRESEVRDKLGPWCRGVRCCWVTAEGKVLLRRAEAEELTALTANANNARKKSAAAAAGAGSAFSTGAFGVLATVRDDSGLGGKLKKKGKESLMVAEEVVPESWEELMSSTVSSADGDGDGGAVIGAANDAGDEAASDAADDIEGVEKS